MIQYLSDTIGNFEFSIIPGSLFSSDGLLIISIDKSAFVNAIEEFIIEPSCESVGNIVITDASDGTKTVTIFVYYRCNGICASYQEGPINSKLL